MPRYILVGASPSNGDSLHPGGVLTLSVGLLTYAKKQGYVVDVINTLRSGFINISIVYRLNAGFKRIAKLLSMLCTGSYNGVIIFSGAGFSFYERIILSFVCKIFGVNDLFVIVDGWFLEIQKSVFIRRFWIGGLLKIPYKIMASGERWNDLFRELGIKSTSIACIHYWLPESFTLSKIERKYNNKNTLRFIFVGWMIKEKGIYELLSAIEELRKNHDFFFTFVGGGTLLEEVRNKIINEEWNERISAPGWVSDEIFQQIISSSDVFVLPSYAEGFPMSLIEAFTKGLPAICSDVGGISDTLSDGVNGFLIPPRQVRPIVEAMENYIRNPHFIVEHSRAAIKMIKVNHNAEHNCKLIFDALK